MGATLIEMAKSYKDPLPMGVVRFFAENSPVLQRIPFETIQGGGLAYSVEETLPGIGFRGVNEEWDQSIGVLNPEFEPLVIAGGELDFDNHILRTQGEARRGAETAAKVRALSLKWSQAFIKGDAVSNPRTFDGLQARLRGRQLLSAGSTSGGTALSLYKLDELLTLVDDANALVMNERMALRLGQAARNPSVGGYITYTPDEFGRQVMNWAGVPILVLKRDNLNNDILPFTEASYAGAATSTSIYAVRFDEEHVHGIQSQPPIVQDLGDIKVKPVQRTRVEWDCGLVVRHPWAAARLWSVADAAITV